VGSLKHRHIVTLEELIDDPNCEKMYVVFEGLAGGQLMDWNSDIFAYTLSSNSAVVREHWGDSVVFDGAKARALEGETAVYTEPAARYLFKQLVEATAYLHEKGVIHKDIKPDNIMLSLKVPGADPRFARVLSIEEWPAVVEQHAQQAPAEAEGDAPQGPQGQQNHSADLCNLNELLSKFALTAKIGDFNTAAVCPQPDCLIYDAEGTCQFTSPECYENSSAGVRGKLRDVWSLGCVLFTMLFGRCPYWAEQNMALQLMIMYENLVIPEGIISEQAQDLIGTLMRKDPNSRPFASSVLDHQWLQATAMES